MSLQMAELHYQSTPKYDSAEIAARAEELLGSGIQVPEGNSEVASTLFIHENHVVEYEDGKVPAQTAIISNDKAPDPSAYLDRIQQSWCCEDAADRIEACSSSMLVTELMANKLEPVERVRLFHGMLQAVVEITKPHAISFGHSQQIIAPDDYLESCAADPIERLGALNVRFFRISNSDSDDMLMDTRGLDEIGLHDIQCHFHDLDPDEVSQVLFNTALYIFENGPAIEAGNTITGTTDDSKWECQFESSIVAPQRDLLDLNPGSAFAAGDR